MLSSRHSGEEHWRGRELVSLCDAVRLVPENRSSSRNNSPGGLNGPCTATDRPTTTMCSFPGLFDRWEIGVIGGHLPSPSIIFLTCCSFTTHRIALYKHILTLNVGKRGSCPLETPGSRHKVIFLPPKHVHRWDLSANQILAVKEGFQDFQPSVNIYIEYLCF